MILLNATINQHNVMFVFWQINSRYPEVVSLLLGWL